MDSAALMRADLWTYLSENCLVKTDRAAMAHGLEIRVPLFVKEGDRVKVHTETREFAGRA